MRNEDQMNQNSTADMLFLCDAMGAEYPYRDLDRLPRWYGAARANPEKRAAGMATLRAYQRQIPTDADFARVPAEEPKRDVVPMSIQWAPDSLCACGSGKAFAECHGADVPIEPSQEAQGHRPTAAVPCEHEKVYAGHVLTSDPPQHPWICRKCNARGADRSGSLRDEQEYNRLIHVRGDNHGQIALGDIRNGAR